MLEVNRGPGMPGHGAQGQRKTLVPAGCGEVRGAGGKIAGHGLHLPA
jgi:hypothetical protein